MHLRMKFLKVFSVPCVCMYVFSQTKNQKKPQTEARHLKKIIGKITFGNSLLIIEWACTLALWWFFVFLFHVVVFFKGGYAVLFCCVLFCFSFPMKIFNIWSSCTICNFIVKIINPVLHLPTFIKMD